MQEEKTSHPRTPPCRWCPLVRRVARGLCLLLAVGVMLVGLAAVVLYGLILPRIDDFRPALAQLLADIEAGEVNAVVVLGLDRLVAVDVDLADRGTLDQRDHQHVAVTADLHVVEVARLEQRARRLGDRRLVDAVVHLDRDVVEHAAGGDPLQAFDTDVGDDETFGKNGPGEPQQQGKQDQETLHGGFWKVLC